MFVGDHPEKDVSAANGGDGYHMKKKIHIGLKQMLVVRQMFSILYLESLHPLMEKVCNNFEIGG